jgi:hypothetical protein
MDEQRKSIWWVQAGGRSNEIHVQALFDNEAAAQEFADALHQLEPYGWESVHTMRVYTHKPTLYRYIGYVREDGTAFAEMFYPSPNPYLRTNEGGEYAAAGETEEEAIRNAYDKRRAVLALPESEPLATKEEPDPV